MDEQERKIPSFIKNRIDYKTETIWAFNLVCRTISSNEIPNVSGNVQVSLITTQGMVVGNIEDIYMANDEEKNFEEIVTQSAFDARNVKLAEIEDSQSDLNITNNTGIVIVRNAKLIPWSGTNKFNFAVLYLFSSDITGFSVGDSSAI